MVKIIDDYGMIWAYSSQRGVIQCLEGLEEYLDKGDLEGAQENGYDCSIASHAVKILEDGGYIDGKSDLTIIDDFGGAWLWSRRLEIIHGLEIKNSFPDERKTDFRMKNINTFGRVLEYLDAHKMLKNPALAVGVIWKILPAYRRGVRTNVS